MLGITLVELFVGSQQDKWGITGTEGVKWFFIIFTIIKAYFIVYAFMHLGDENRLMKWLIIGPYAGFVIYLISMTVLGEGNYASKHKLLIDPIIQMQHAGGGEHGGGESGGGEHK
jgi:cytochrome c oxidase subunit IV